MFPLGLDRPELLWVLPLGAPVLALGWYRTRRYLPPGRLRWIAALRALGVSGLVLALAGLYWKVEQDALGVIFVLDRSASVDPAEQLRAEAFVREALKSQGSEDQSGVVVFGDRAMVEASPREALDFHAVSARPSPHQSELAAGLRLASALLPADRPRRVVLLSDGEQTRGDAATQVLLSAGDDLTVYTVPLETVRGADVVLEDLLSPARADEGQAWEVRAVLRADQPTTGALRLYRNADYLGETRVALEGGGAEVFTFRQEAEGSGLYRFRATFEPDDPALDAVPQNNEAVATVQVTGRPRVLYAEGYPEQAHHLRRVLEEEGFVVEVVPPERLPGNVSGLRPYAAVILSDVPAWLLSRRQQEGVQTYVRDLGRGLVMVGGDRSFGLGGYYKTPIAEALPVRMDLDDQTPLPKLGMVLALDKSGSMGGGAGSKLAMAKEAAIATTELLAARDMLGVIGFDSSASWVVPFGDLHDKPKVVQTIASIQPGGGTDIYPALERGFFTLNHSGAALKHVILLSDGITGGAAFEPLIRQGLRDDITLTAIAVGDDADASTMAEFARWGGGNYYLVTDPSAIPAIFTRETLLATKAFLIEEPLRVKAGAPSELLEGVDVGALPPLLGMVATQPRPRATVALLRDGDPALPVLITGRHGLGRSVAFTSDCKQRWAGQWVGTEDYARLWTQTLRWLAGDQDQDGMTVEAEVLEGVLRITADASGPDGSFRNFLQGEARVVAPDLTVLTLPLQQTGPGRYQTALPVDQDGSWLVSAVLRSEGQDVARGVTEAVQAWSPEYAHRGGGAALIAELGRLGGGGALTDPAQVFARPAHGRVLPKPLWPALLALSALLLLLEVAARRLDLAPAKGRVARPLAALPAQAPPAPRAPSGSAAEVPDDAFLDDADLPAAPESAYANRLLEAKRAARTRKDTR